MRHNARVWSPQIVVLNGARALPTDEDPGGEEEEEVPEPGPPPLNMNEVQRAVTAELNSYKSILRIDMRETLENGDKGKYIDPLTWWKDRMESFPTLCQIARKVLCIPVTSAPSERVFSVAELTISKMRSRLDSENASCLVFLRDNWDLSDQMNSPQVELLN